ncbi:MAG: hypothetical protein Kow0042_25360 [Calditrichia bacterium]
MVSIVIPSYNSEKTIYNCLQALHNQNYEGEYEIILADSSVDQTPEIVKEHFPRVKLIRFESKTDPGTARNAGVRQSKGDVILFIDSDCIASEDWVQKICRLHDSHPEVAAVGGAAANGNPSDDEVAWAGYMAEFREYIPENPAGYVWHIPTLNISYKRWVFEKYGYFDSRYYPQEDLVFNYQLTQNGDKILFDPSIIVWHFHRSELQGFFRHQKNIGRITAQVLKILPLQGHFIARNKLLFLITGPVLPLVKFQKTLVYFFRKRKQLLFQHPMAVFFLKIGLFYWYLGFAQGVFSKSLGGKS